MSAVWRNGGKAVTERLCRADVWVVIARLSSEGESYSYIEEHVFEMREEAQVFADENFISATICRRIDHRPVLR